MRHRRPGALASVGTVVASLAIGSFASAASPSRTQLNNSRSPAAARTPSTGAAPAKTQMDFQVNLRLSDQAGAEALARAVSTPGSASYGKYVTPAQWEARFSPTAASVNEVKSFLTQNGFSVGNVSADRLAVSATGTARQVENKFGTSLSYHKVRGQSLLLADTNLSVPSSIGGVIGGVTGVSDAPAEPAATGGPSLSSTTAGENAQPPAGFRNAPPCGAYYGQKLATTLPPLPGYPANAPYAPRGYAPPQMRSAYGLTDANNGAGKTVAIVDAYAAPTIFADAHRYAALNDPGNPLKSSQFSQLVAKSFNKGKLCGGQNGWWGEETLDVEAVHGTAPGASILYAGAKNCLDKQLDNTLRTIVDNHLADVITNSYGTDDGEVLDSADTRQATDQILLMAAALGITVTFSSGDSGDSFSTVGAAGPDYPASSPWATAIGGTTLQIGAAGQRTGEFGWSTGVSTYCNQDEVSAGACTKKQLGTWGPLTYLYGSGGGTSFSYDQPFYQAGVVPASLSQANAGTIGPGAKRVVPDISMDADPTTGYLVGETQTFPDGVYYDQYRIGGTSLSSPLMAGLVARADEAAGGSLGFLNPKLYAMYGKAGDLSDIVSPASPQDIIRADYINGVDASNGIKDSARTIDDEGQQQFCNAVTMECSTANITLHTTPGYDDMTGLGTPGTGFQQALAASK